MIDRNVIRLHDASIMLWERKVRDDLRTRCFDPLIRFMRLNRGWRVRTDPRVNKDYPSIRMSHRLASKGELLAHLELSGRTLKVEIWQERYNITHSNGGRYEFDKRRKMPYLLGKRCDLEIDRITSFLVEQTDYDVEDRDYPGETADEHIRRAYRESCHTDPALGHPRFTNGDRDRTGGNGSLLNQEQTVWFYDHKGRLLRGQAFYHLNNMWFVKLNRMELIACSCGELYSAPPGDLRKKRNEKLRQSRLTRLMQDAAKRFDFLEAEKYRTLLGVQVVKTTA